MGRTARQRKNKKQNLLLCECKIKLSHDLTLIKLVSWLKSLNWVPLNQLHPTNFPNTGRGLMAGENIAVNDVLVQIPLCALITSKTVDESNISHILARKSFSCEDILTAFLIMEKRKITKSKWAPYIYSLPTDFSTPLYLSPYVVEYLPDFLKSPIYDALQDAEGHFQRLKELFPTIHKDEFNWAWSCVNTRAVYLPEPLQRPSKLRIVNRDCLALAPYLDLFNHSNSATVEVKVTNDGYALLTKSSFKKHDQVFISYGPHSNLKLFLDYGFVIPNNPHDKLPLSKVGLTELAGLNSETYNSSIEAKFEVLALEGFLSSVAYTREGITWSSLAALRLLQSSKTNVREWFNIIYNDTEHKFDRTTTERILRTAQQLEQILDQSCQELSGYISTIASTPADRALLSLASECKDVARCAHQRLVEAAEFELLQEGSKTSSQFQDSSSAAGP